MTDIEVMNLAHKAIAEMEKIAYEFGRNVPEDKEWLFYDECRVELFK